jgi:predicted PurR-regulated permease PerM
MVDEDRRTVLEAAPADAEVVVPAANSGNTDPLVIRMPVDIRSAALTVIAGIALVLFLQYAQAVLIPVVLGTLIFYALDPIVDRAQKLRVPRMIGAAVVLLAVFGGTGYGVWTLRDDVLAVVEELPGAARRVRATLASERRREPGAIDKLQEAAKEIDRTAAAAAGPEPRDPRGVQRVQIVQPIRTSDYLMWGSMGALALTGQLVMILFLSYFLLVADDLYKRKLVKIAPTLSK